MFDSPGKGKFNDLIYYSSKGFGFFFTTEPESKLIQFDENGNFSPIKSYEARDNMVHGKVLRKDRGQQHLFVNCGNHINILFNVQGGKYGFEGNLRQFDSSLIMDFRVVKSDGVITCCDNMQLYYHEIDSNKGSRLICKIDIGISVVERVTSLAVCPLSRYIAVATDSNDILTNLVMFEIDSNKMIQFRDELNFYNDSTLKKPFNFIRDMSLALNQDGYPLIIAFYFAGDRCMTSFTFDGKMIQRFSPIKYHSGIFSKCSETASSIWTTDMKGVVKKLSLTGQSSPQKIGQASMGSSLNNFQSGHQMMDFSKDQVLTVENIIRSCFANPDRRMYTQAKFGDNVMPLASQDFNAEHWISRARNELPN